MSIKTQETTIEELGVTNLHILCEPTLERDCNGQVAVMRDKEAMDAFMFYTGNDGGEASVTVPRDEAVRLAKWIIPHMDSENISAD